MVSHQCSLFHWYPLPSFASPSGSVNSFCQQGPFTTRQFASHSPLFFGGKFIGLRSSIFRVTSARSCAASMLRKQASHARSFLSPIPLSVVTLSMYRSYHRLHAYRTEYLTSTKQPVHNSRRTGLKFCHGGKRVSGQSGMQGLEKA